MQCISFATMSFDIEAYQAHKVAKNTSSSTSDSINYAFGSVPIRNLVRNYDYYTFARTHRIGDQCISRHLKRPEKHSKKLTYIHA
jgi:hypothetical protein